MHSFAIKTFTEKGAVLMAHEVARSYEYFFKVFMDSDVLEHVFTEKDVQGYKESDEWRCYVDSLTVGESEWARALSVRALRPILGVLPS